ncbi:ZIP family zinc transporter [Lentzea guizhouensis]|uniref:ZIP family zinc transporter n=1 Tax=Lentzea guizhouensis TaxID=1586287 RepID=A0A1B2HSL7_9PSEU|nr:ZIP family zinc transporter [Lentzea guizhouensis]ANZ40736.1 ZIP family zinc transporter [Lentzea guizhouensis]
MAQWVEAGLWGLAGGGALVVGALVAWFVRVPRDVVAVVMAFGAGVLMAAAAFELVDEAEQTGGLLATAAGFCGGAVVYVAANVVLARYGARHRKRAADQPSEAQQAGSGTAIAVGALLDGVPESVVLGVSLLGGGGVGVAMVVAVVISNVPEGLSSVAGMKQAGRGPGYVFGVWGAIAVASAVSAALGNVLLDGASPQVVAVISATAAGAILAMIADTMIPEAYERARLYTGLCTTAGFLTAFVVERLG